ncbi:MAG: esterase-like activity of phytase family protein [Hyphomicrobiaceae bacterium]|nr:esterase-like activity of phytase family protein [Hyphomicrobiaceae bacterium]
MKSTFPAFLIAILFSSLLTSDAISRSRPLQKNIDIKVQSKIISFDQVNPDKKRFGRLTWRGGLELSSDQKKFGGYSGLVLTDKGNKLIAVSDQGTWLQASVKYKDGALAGLKQPHIGPLRKKSGKVLRKKKKSDAEDIALWRNKKGVYALISFERKHRIGRFSLNSNGILKAFSYLKLPRGVFKTTKNKGLEALTVLTDKNNNGTVLTFLERHHGKKNRHRGWLIRGKKSWPLYLKSRNDFKVTGMATLANGNVLVLERYFSYFAGVQMRIREIKAENIKKNAVLDGEILITATMRYNIDNMEGISAHTNHQGEQIITLMSDDNFNKSGLQRTLLMQFKLD